MQRAGDSPGGVNLFCDWREAPSINWGRQSPRPYHFMCHCFGSLPRASVRFSSYARLVRSVPGPCRTMLQPAPGVGPHPHGCSSGGLRGRRLSYMCAAASGISLCRAGCRRLHRHGCTSSFAAWHKLRRLDGSVGLGGGAPARWRGGMGRVRTIQAAATWGLPACLSASGLGTGSFGACRHHAAAGSPPDSGSKRCGSGGTL
jgi:hypothetical protein